MKAWNSDDVGSARCPQLPMIAYVFGDSNDAILKTSAIDVVFAVLSLAGTGVVAIERLRLENLFTFKTAFGGTHKDRFDMFHPSSLLGRVEFLFLGVTSKNKEGERSDGQ